MKARISANIKGLLTCGIIGIIFWLLPYMFSLSYTAAEFYIKYRALGMTISGITILNSIHTLILLKKWANQEGVDISG